MKEKKTRRKPELKRVSKEEEEERRGREKINKNKIYQGYRWELNIGRNAEQGKRV